MKCIKFNFNFNLAFFLDFIALKSEVDKLEVNKLVKISSGSNN